MEQLFIIWVLVPWELNKSITPYIPVGCTSSSEFTCMGGVVDSFNSQGAKTHESTHKMKNS